MLKAISNTSPLVYLHRINGLDSLVSGYQLRLSLNSMRALPGDMMYLIRKI